MPRRRCWGFRKAGSSVSLVSHPVAQGKAISSLKTDPLSSLQAPLSLLTRTHFKDRAGTISLCAG